MAGIADYRGPISIHIHSNATHINAAGIVHGGVGNVLEQTIRKEVAARLGSSQAIENETSDAVRSSQAIENETSDAVRSSQAIESSAQGIRKKATATVGCLHGAETTSSGAESGQTNRTETTATLGRVDDIGHGPPARGESGPVTGTGTASGVGSKPGTERAHAGGGGSGPVTGTGTASGVGSKPGTGRAHAGGGGSGQHATIAEGCGQYNRQETTVYKQVSNDQRSEADGEASESIHTTLGAGQHGTDSEPPAPHLEASESIQPRRVMTKSSSDKRQTDIDFYAACKAGDVDRVARLLSGDRGNLNRKDGNGRTGLMMAAYQGHKDVVEFLVSNGADLTLEEKGGDTILHAACRGGDINIVKCVLSKDDVDVNCTDKSGMTPSMSAARWGYTDVVKLLVRRGSNLQMVDDEGDTVLHYACRGGHDEIAEYVLSRNTALVNVKNRSGKTAARVAKDEGHYLVYERLKSVHSGCYLM